MASCLVLIGDEVLERPKFVEVHLYSAEKHGSALLVFTYLRRNFNSAPWDVGYF